MIIHVLGQYLAHKKCGRFLLFGATHSFWNWSGRRTKTPKRSLLGRRSVGMRGFKDLPLPNPTCFCSSSERKMAWLLRRSSRRSSSLHLPVKGASPASCNSTWTAAPTAVATRRFFWIVVSISALACRSHGLLGADLRKLKRTPKYF